MRKVFIVAIFLLQFPFEVGTACMQRVFPSFVGSFVRIFSHATNYEVIDFLVDGIEVLMALVAIKWAKLTLSFLCFFCFGVLFA